MNYAAWIRRASRFLRSLTQLPGDLEVYDSIEEPARDKHTRDWLRSEKCSIPARLKEFIGKASKRCCFRYTWNLPKDVLAAFRDIYPGRTEITGGADLCEAAGYQNYDNREWFANFMPRIFSGVGSGVKDPERERGRIAILKMRSGDQILWNCNEGEIGTIVYVRAEESDGRVISRSFDEFLSAWEKIAYIEPSLENLQPWLDSSSGLLSPDEGLAQRLRKIFTDVASQECAVSDSPDDGLRSWLQRAEAFVRQRKDLPGTWGVSVSMEPPITNAEADLLAAKLPLGLPAPLRTLYVEGAAQIECRYHWRPLKKNLRAIEDVFPHESSFYGGAKFVPWTELLNVHGIHEWWDGVDDDPSEDVLRAREVWRHTVPFISVGNGDVVGLHVTGDPQNLPVVYLSHENRENPVTPISPSLEQFLTDWENLCYIGPEIWLLNHFLTRKGNGGLKTAGKKARIWREFLMQAAKTE